MSFLFKSSIKLHKLILFFEYLTGLVPVLENQCRFRLYEIGGEIIFYKKKNIHKLILQLKGVIRKYINQMKIKLINYLVPSESHRIFSISYKIINQTKTYTQIRTRSL